MDPLAELLRCPSCDGALTEDLACGCGRWGRWRGIPRLVREGEVRGTDRLMRLFYDGLPRLHDPAVRWLLPVLQGGPASDIREGTMRRLALGGLRGGRILEVGIGAGAHLPLIRRDLPRGSAPLVVGADLSLGMLAQCQRRLDRGVGLDVRLVQADAHALPFASGAFDRVFHVGAMGSYRDPRSALAEMARVAKPGTPIVVVDEQLDPARRHGLLTRAAFRALTFYDRAPHCPRELLPPGATHVREEQVSRFYYCLSFSMPPR
ncbi:MAG: hypothetical protein AMXMBFR64_30670 [Myxococcales bacterium]